MTSRTPGNDRFALVAFLVSAAFLVFVFGWVVGEYKIFPYPLISRARAGFDELKIQRLRFADLGSESEKDLPFYYKRIDPPHPPATQATHEACPGLNLITRVAAGLELKAEIVDMEGALIHEWRIDWFDIWPDAKHLPKSVIPRSRPGTHIHGAVIMDNGDLVFNFEHLGLVRLNRRGGVVWRLPYQTHHSVQRHDDGNLWVCGEKYHGRPDSRFPNQAPPFVEYTILEVTPDGAIANEWSVPEILKENNLSGLLHLGSFKNGSTKVKGDVIHLNDVEPFPDTMQEAFFRKGDILVSLRNINTVFVFNRHTRKVTFVCAGRFVRQHDPDFIDGNRFSVFDNNNIAPPRLKTPSRILIVSAPSQETEVFFEGSKAVPFSTNIMGKHQWLPNGNLLITESRNGRAFEINPAGKVVWEYVNEVGDGVVGLVEEVRRIPLDAARLFAADQHQTEAGQ